MTENSKQQTFRHICAISLLLVLCAYISWRFTIINDKYIFLSYLFFFTSLITFVSAIFIIVTTWNDPSQPLTTFLCSEKVDVLIPTYKEPINVIEKTLKAASKLDYPCQIIILDDAGRKDVKNLTEELGLKYLCRGNNIHAKAGNLNFGLRHSTAEYVAVFDADHIPQKEAITLLMQYFTSNDVAFVQSPQDHFNTDAVQFLNTEHEKKIWHDQSVFYDLNLPAANTYNVASCVGTGVIYRRKAINDIGGIPHQTLTEDTHTSLKLHMNNWKSIYLPKPVAYGISPSDNSEYFKTRHRWAQGNFQVIKHEKIFTSKNLNFLSKIFYLNFLMQSINEFQLLILIFLPIFSLFFGWQSFIVTPLNILLLLSFPVVFHFLLKEITFGYTQFWKNEVLSIMRFPIHIKALYGMLKINKPWHSSNKNIKGKIDWGLLTPQLSILFFCASSILYGFIKLYPDFRAGPIICALQAYFIQPGNQSTGSFKDFLHAPLDDGYSLELLILCGFWSFFSIFRVISYLRILFKKVKNSSENFRFKMHLPVFSNDFVLASAMLTNRISEDTITISTKKNTIENLAIKKNYLLKILLPSGYLEMKTRYAGTVGNEHIFSITKGNKKSKLIGTLYSVAWHRYLYFAETPFNTIYLSLKRLFTEQKNPRKVETVIFKENLKKNSEHLGFMESYGEQLHILSFSSLNDGSLITVRYAENQEIKTYKIIGKNEISTVLHLTKNLDDTECHYYRVTCVN